MEITVIVTFCILLFIFVGAAIVDNNKNKLSFCNHVCNHEWIIIDEIEKKDFISKLESESLALGVQYNNIKLSMDYHEYKEQVESEFGEYPKYFPSSIKNMVCIKCKEKRYDIDKYVKLYNLILKLIIKERNQKNEQKRKINDFIKNYKDIENYKRCDISVKDYEIILNNINEHKRIYESLKKLDKEMEKYKLLKGVD